MADTVYAVKSSDSGSIHLVRRPPALRTITMEVGNSPGRTIITRSYPVNNGTLYELPTYTIKVSGTDNSGSPLSKSWEVYRFGVYFNDGRNSHYRSRGLFVAGLADDQTYTVDKFDPAYSVHSARSTEMGAWHVTGSFLIHDGPDTPMTPGNFVIEGLYASVGCIEICGRPHGFDKFNEFIISLSGTRKAGTEALVEIGRAKIITVHYLKAARPPLKEYPLP